MRTAWIPVFSRSIRAVYFCEGSSRMPEAVQHQDFGDKIGGAKKGLWGERGLYSYDLSATSSLALYTTSAMPKRPFYTGHDEQIKLVIKILSRGFVQFPKTFFLYFKQSKKVNVVKSSICS